MTMAMVLDPHCFCHCLHHLVYLCIILPHLQYLKTTTKLKKTSPQLKNFCLLTLLKHYHLATREKVAVAEILSNTNTNSFQYKFFPKAHAVFENNQQKLFDDPEHLSRPEMTTISHMKVMLKELSEGKLPDQLKFFSGRGSRGGSELKIPAMEKIRLLNERNNAFLEYLTTDYTREILAKSKM